MVEDYYTSRKSQLLRDFDKTVKRLKNVFASRYGGESTDAMIKEVRMEYEGLIPQLPYVGGRKPFTEFVVATAQFLAMYRVLKNHGRTVEETGRLIYELCEELLDSYPRFVLRLVGNMNFSGRHLKALRKRAAESQRRENPDDYVYAFVEGDGREFDFGVDYTECATLKFLIRQGAPELASYTCLVDILYSERFGWGLVRTMTLADGYPKCDFRFKKGGVTRVASWVSVKNNL